MKKLFFILAFLPLFATAQTCKPYSEISGHKGTSDINQKELAEATKLEVKGDCGEYNIISFEFTAVVKRHPVVYTGVGTVLSDQMKKILAGLNLGDKVYLDNVKAKGPNGSTKSIPGITLIIKDAK